MGNVLNFFSCLPPVRHLGLELDLTESVGDLVNPEWYGPIDAARDFNRDIINLEDRVLTLEAEITELKKLIPKDLNKETSETLRFI